MPNRIIREGITTSESLSFVSFEAECLFYRLLVTVDDFGLFDARPVIVRARCLPLRDCTIAQVEQWLIELEQQRVIARYEVDGRPYLRVLRWEQRARASRSKYPMPDDKKSGASTACGKNDRHVTVNCQANDGHVLPEERGARNEERGTRNEDRRDRAVRGTRLPHDWQPSEQERRWAEDARPDLDIAIEIEKFRDYWHAKAGAGAAKLDWTATWRNWIRNAHSGRRPDPSGPQALPRLKL